MQRSSHSRSRNDSVTTIDGLLAIAEGIELDGGLHQLQRRARSFSLAARVRFHLQASSTVADAVEDMQTATRFESISRKSTRAAAFVSFYPDLGLTHGLCGREVIRRQFADANGGRSLSERR